MFIERSARARIATLMEYYPVAAVTGPRQAGKTTLVRAIAPEKPYVNLESPAQRALVEADPVGFLASHPDGAIIDEIQRVPDLMSYLQVQVDADRTPGRYIISGSQNLLLSQAVSQSLAGRAAYTVLPPLSRAELKAAGHANENWETDAFTGFYPGQRTADIPPAVFFDQYGATYAERDLRLIRNVSDLAAFRRFMALLAGRIGQVANWASLSSDVGISAKTAEEWAGVLEASYLTYTLRPYHNNFGKRYIKSPKLLFTDTGFACRLLGLGDAAQLSTHYMRGSLFENLVIMEVWKHITTLGLDCELFFWRDSNQNEVDLVIKTSTGLIPVEIKSSNTFDKSFLRGINVWRAAAGADQPAFIVYAGEPATVQGVQLTNHNNLEGLLTQLK
jgi:predicted AAA+ superfamily ATPase